MKKETDYIVSSFWRSRGTEAEVVLRRMVLPNQSTSVKVHTSNNQPNIHQSSRCEWVVLDSLHVL
jgi:hypothetical protein